MRFIAAALAVLFLTTGTPAEARHHHAAHDGLICRHNTIRVTTAFNLDICVDPRFAARFQAFFAALKSSGCHVTEIVCQAYGHAPGSNHIGGGACDVNQRAKNRTIACMYHASTMIRSAGLYDGCAFHDCGHVEAMRGLGNYGGTIVSARRHRHHPVRQLAIALPQPEKWPPPQ